MTRTYNEKVDNVVDWVKIVNYHWTRLEGDLHNDKDFWNDTLHAMDDSDWWDWVDIMPALKAQHPDAFAKYPYAEVSTEYITKKLHKKQPVVKKNITGKNFDAFRALMNIKDVVNEIAGVPTIEFKKKRIKPPPKHIKVKPDTVFHSLFDIEDNT